MEKRIKDFEDYAITTEGKVISYKYREPRIMSTWFQASGYENIKLCKNNNVNNLEWCDRRTNLELSSVGFTRNKFKCYIEEVSSGKIIKEFETIKSACEWASENLGCSKSYLQRKTGNISNGYRVMKV